MVSPEQCCAWYSLITAEQRLKVPATHCHMPSGDNVFTLYVIVPVELVYIVLFVLMLLRCLSWAAQCHSNEGAGPLGPFQRPDK